VHGGCTARTHPGAAHVPYHPLAVGDARDDVSPSRNRTAAPCPGRAHHRPVEGLHWALGASGHAVSPSRRSWGCSGLHLSSLSNERVDFAVRGWSAWPGCCCPACASRSPAFRPVAREARPAPEAWYWSACSSVWMTPTFPTKARPSHCSGPSFDLAMRRPGQAGAGLTWRLFPEDPGEPLSHRGGSRRGTGRLVELVYKHKHLLGGVRFGKRLWRFPEQELATLLSQPAMETTQSVAHDAPSRQARTTPAHRRWRLG
jgi:hypothetical protein